MRVSAPVEACTCCPMPVNTVTGESTSPMRLMNATRPPMVRWPCRISQEPRPRMNTRSKVTIMLTESPNTPP